MEQHKRYTKTVNQLSRLIAINHIYLSGIKIGMPSSSDMILQNKIIKNFEERRIVAVVGAGASFNAGLPLAKQAIKILENKMRIEKKALDDELDRLETVYRLDKNEFETYLRAMGTSVTKTKKLRNELQNIYGFRNPPVLTYEILSHLLKHRFLDAIINFNFDELLDQSILDELGPNNYHYIISDGDCLDVKKNNRTNRYDLPLYIKPHGSSEHKSTLRFTREDYFGLPEDIGNTISELFSGFPLILIVIGYGMQSFEFNQILKKSKSPFDIYYFDSCDNSEIDKKFKDLSSYIKKIYHIQINHSFTLDDAIKTLWNKISNQYKSYYKPRHILRHELVCDIFSHIKIPFPKQDKEQYFRDRMFIELVLSLAKSKGLIDLGILSSDRCGRYYEYYQHCEKQCPSLYDICKQMNLEDVGYSKEVLRLRKPVKDADTGKYAIVAKTDFINDIPKLLDSISGNVSDRVRNHLYSHEDFFRKTLIALFNGDEVEVNTKQDDFHSKIFDKHKTVAINTHTSLRYHTIKLLQELNSGDYLFVVAETGEWLLHRNIKKYLSKTNINLYLLLADLSLKKHLKRSYSSILSGIKQIPWWSHNKHMTIIGHGRRAIKSIYFIRRLRSLNISPVFLEENDSKAVFESFYSYWKKYDWYEDRPKLGREIFEDQAKMFDNLDKDQI